MTELPTRRKWALVAFAILGLATVAVGVWEFRISGAMHQLALGAVMILLVGLARLLWMPRPGRAKGRP